jgi:DNA-binding transcriptional regulator GbsR (MarR family)
MAEPDHAAVIRFEERFTQVLVDSGMPRIASRIFVAILASPDAQLTASELTERTKASPAAISGGVRYLTQLGLVHRGRQTGSRRDHYTVDTDVWARVIMQRSNTLDRWWAQLREGVEAVGSGTAAGKRLAHSADFFAFVNSEMAGLMERWEEHVRERDTDV